LNNPYLPIKAQITEVAQETASDLDIKTFKLKLPEGAALDFMPGQFLEVSLPGVGEAPFGFASSPLVKSHIDLCIKKMGTLTQAVHELVPGNSIYLRGPFGNTFPVEEMEGSNIVYITGGLGLAPLRPLIDYVFDDTKRGKYGEVRMLCAARSSADFIFRYDYEKWERKMGRKIVLTIDRPECDWNGCVGFPHTMVKDLGIDSGSTYALLCGPPLMIKAVSASLVELGLPKERIITTLENRMSCGVGKCGKCNVGHMYVCVDGPVFRMSQLSKMPDEY
jgi:NAD(P)H-flavin reductase